MSIIHSPITQLAIHLLFHTHPSNLLIRYLHVYHAVYSVFHPSIIQPSIKSSLSTSVPPLSPSTHPPINATVDGFVGIDVFILFCLWVQRAGLLPVLQSSIHRPFTIFWPTDRALSSLPPERQRWLSSPDHQEELAATVKAHIIRSARVTGLQCAPLKWPPGRHNTFVLTCVGSGCQSAK